MQDANSFRGIKRYEPEVEGTEFFNVPNFFLLITDGRLQNLRWFGANDFYLGKSQTPVKLNRGWSRLLNLEIIWQLCEANAVPLPLNYLVYNIWYKLWFDQLIHYQDYHSSKKISHGCNQGFTCLRATNRSSSSNESSEWLSNTRWGIRTILNRGYRKGEGN